MRIEILHTRDPDSACDFDIYVDGVPQKMAEAMTDDGIVIDIVTVDPGRGYDGDDWQHSHAFELAVPERSEGFKAAIDDAFTEARESKYISDPSGGWDMTGGA